MVKLGGEVNFGVIRSGVLYDMWLGFPSLEVI